MLPLTVLQLISFLFSKNVLYFDSKEHLEHSAGGRDAHSDLAVCPVNVTGTLAVGKPEEMRRTVRSPVSRQQSYCSQRCCNLLSAPTGLISLTQDWVRPNVSTVWKEKVLTSRAIIIISTWFSGGPAWCESSEKTLQPWCTVTFQTLSGDLVYHINPLSDTGRCG